MCYKKAMPKALPFIPAKLGRWEWVALAVLLAACLFLAVSGRGHKERRRYDRFLRNAPRVQAALERFAADHGGAFPPDAMALEPPQGLDPGYIKWDPGWRIDYEAHPNGKGGQAICLEFGGPYRRRLYFGLCLKPRVRAKYGQGQKVPGNPNRIWVVRESAAILPPDKAK